MRKIFISTGNLIRSVIDFFYPLFKRYMSPEFFRYGVTGVGNLFFDWFMYFFIFNFILQKQMLCLGFVTLSSHIATMVIKFPITLTSGFYLQKYVTFTTSTNRGKEQIIRYYIIGFINLGLTYVGLKIFVEMLHLFPSVANVVVSILVTVFSYFSQRKFTFKTVS